MQRVNGFYGHIQRNNLRSVVMFLGFALACQLIGLAVLVWPLMFIDPNHAPVFDFYGYLQRYGIPVFIGSLVLFGMRFFLHVKHVEQDLKFHLVSQMQEQRLWKIVEIQAIGAGIALPQVGIIEDDARNAFACGMSEQSAVVVVTRGLLRTLDDEELEAVIAHEISHIVNGDIRMLAVANVMLSTLFAIKKRNPFRIRGTKSFIALIFLPAFLIMALVSGLVTSVAVTLGMLTRLLIASSREFIADAEAVRMTKNPAALISALRRIEGFSEIDDLDEAHDAMMIDGAVEGTYATHPTIAERIEVLTKHAGAMALGAGIRKDTRTFADLGPAKNGVFGRRVQMPAKADTEIKKGMIGRVIAGSKVDAFGLTKKKRRIVIAIILIPMIFQGIALLRFRASGNQKAFAHNIGELVAAETGKFGRVKSVNSSLTETGVRPELAAHRVRVDKLRAMDPINARCYAGAHYIVRDSTVRPFKEPDKTIVADFISGTKKLRNFEAEMFAGMRIKSIRGVNRATSSEVLNRALALYMLRRKYLLGAMHMFYGDEGLEWMREAYESDSDKNVIEIINKKRNDGIDIFYGKRGTLDIALLIDNSKDFIPCYARDRIEQAKMLKKSETAAIPNKDFQLGRAIKAQ